MLEEEVINKKKYLYHKLRKDIQNHKYQHMTPLPPEVEFARQLGVSRTTLREALKCLENEGMLLRLPSKGTFVQMGKKEAEIKTYMILVRDNVNETYSANAIIPGIQNVALTAGKKIEICYIEHIEAISYDKDTIGKLNKEIAGVFMFGGRYTGREKRIRLLQMAEIPVVMCSCYAEDINITGFAGVRVDRRQAWKDTVLALKKYGYKRILSVGNEEGIIQGFNNDLQSYTDFLKAEGIYNKKFLKFVPYKYEAIKNLLIEIMEMKEVPEVIMAHSDFYAINFYKAADELAINIPNDIAIMGFSGYSAGRLLNPPLATVDSNFFEMGRDAMDLMLRASEWFEQSNPPDILIPHKIIMRKSAMKNKIDNGMP